MTKARLERCSHCDGFLPTGAASCPLCTWRPPRWVRHAVGVASGAALSMTLSACYGGACAGGACHEAAYPVATDACDDPTLDRDGDGYCGEQDPDESDPQVPAPR